ncbi:MAG: hypothetical protein ABW115_19680 [Candidatus Thiodiazotropha sp. 6PLUC6]
MTRKTCWLCDVIGITGACLLLAGLYFIFAWSAVLMAGGALLMGYAMRLSYLCKHDP